LRRVAAALAPLESAALSGLQDFAGLAARHWEAVRLASTDGAEQMLASADGAALAAAFDEIAEKVEPFAVSLKHYPQLFLAPLAARVLALPPASPPASPTLPSPACVGGLGSGATEGREGASRIRIYGPLEARLTSADRVVVGSLVEGVWPPDPHADPWLSRPMRQALGLDPPERRIGLAAHDFSQLLGAPEVFVTYPAKRGGA